MVPSFQPDEFFSAQQQARLDVLMTRWRTARDGGGVISADEQAELQSLVEEELRAATRRAEARLV